MRTLPVSVFPLTLWLISKCPNFLLTIVPQALKRRLCALNFIPNQYLSILYYIPENYLPLFQQIADSLKKIGLVGTMTGTVFISFKCIYQIHTYSSI